jgi:hypothetical protein
MVVVIGGSLKTFSGFRIIEFDLPCIVWIVVIRNSI